MKREVATYFILSQVRNDISSACAFAISTYATSKSVQRESEANGIS